VGETIAKMGWHVKISCMLEKPDAATYLMVSQRVTLFVMVGLSFDSATECRFCTRRCRIPSGGHP
jgi:hypothetical protein